MRQDIALDWCNKHPEWRRICDIPDSESLYKSFDELPKREQNKWKRDFSSCAKQAFEEFGTKTCKFKRGYVTEDGVFHKNVLDFYGNFMTVLKVGSNK